MSDPTFGISITRVDEGARPAITSDMAIVGLPFVSADADAAVFPINEPVLLYSDDAEKIAAMGSGGAPDVELLHQQLGEFQAAATIVAVRCAKGATDAETAVNVAGSATLKNGMFALVKAAAALGVSPRIILPPGDLTGIATSYVSGVTIAAGGEDYEVGDEITATGGGGSGFEAVVSAVDSDGAITDVEIVSGGHGYTSAPTLSVSSTAGKNASLTATVATGGNVICANLPSLCERLLAVGVVNGPGTSYDDTVAWRQSLPSSERLIPVDPFVVVAGSGGAVERPLSAAVAGIGVRRDHEFAGRPFHSWANQPVYGVVGPSRAIDFSILDGATEGQQLLAQNIGIAVRGERTDGAIADGGFVFVGTDTTSDDTLWRFYNQVRGRDYIHLMFIKTLRYYLGRRNIDRGTIEDIINTMVFGLRDIQATGDLLGFRVGFRRDQNSPEQLRLGRFHVEFQAEEPPVLRYLGIQSARYRPALDALLDDLLVNLNSVT